MYNTSQKWKENIYNNVQCAMNIYIDNILINPDYILDFKKGGDVFDNEFYLGSTPSQYIELKIYKDEIALPINSIRVEYGILVNNSLTVTEVNSMLVGTLNGIQVRSLSTECNDFEMIPMGIYNIDDYTDNDDGTVTIKALDNMIKFEFNYDGSTMNYPATLLQVAQDICTKAGVELGSTSFLNSNKQIAVYDNTVTAREYISYIAESAGAFAFIGRDGKLYFRNIYEDETVINIELFGSYKWGEEFKISKVSYEDGVRSFKFGNDTRNNVWINQDNMYIVDENQVQNIYNKLNNTTINSFEGKTIIDPAIDIGDKIIIDGKPVMYQGEKSLEGRFIAQISSKIQIKQKEETTVKKESQKVVNRRVQSRINQAEGKIEQLVEETTENSEKLTKHEQTIDSMKDTLKSQETKIETVDSKANKAQSTADTATTKANNAQTSADNAQTIANTANTNAQNAQKTADANTTKITTNTTKIAEVEKTVDGITQSVSAVEEKIETVESTADSAKTTANTANTNAQKAQTTADNINTNLTTNYYNKTETDTKFNQTASNIELLAEEVNTITGDNSVKNGDFKNELNNWSTSVSNGDISVVDYNNKKYANLTCRNGNTVLTQRVGGLFAGIEYNLQFDIFDNGEVLDISDCGTLSVEISQDKENSEEIISVLSRTINVTKEEQTINLKFTLNQNSKDVLINFKLSLGSYSAYDISAMITNVILSGGSVTEKFSKINVGLDNIESTVSKKVGENEIISKINQSAEAVGIDANKIELTANDVLNLLAGNTINLSGKSIKISSNNFNVDENGNMSANNAKINGGYITLKTTNSNLSNPFLKIVNNNNTNQLFEAGATFMWLTDKDGSSGIRLETNQYTDEGSCLPVIQLLGGDGSFSQVSSQSIFSPNISQTSLEEQKKNFEKLQNGLDIINNTEIYKYNLKSQADGDKKHIGFVIGKNYKYSNEITALDNEGKEVGVDTYSMISVAYKAIQELAEEKADLIQRIETLEKEVNK